MHESIQNVVCVPFKVRVFPLPEVFVLTHHLRARNCTQTLIKRRTGDQCKDISRKHAVHTHVMKNQ
jgi:hypothetical protein